MPTRVRVNLANAQELLELPRTRPRRRTGHREVSRRSWSDQGCRSSVAHPERSPHPHDRGARRFPRPTAPPPRLRGRSGASEYSRDSKEAAIARGGEARCSMTAWGALPNRCIGRLRPLGQRLLHDLGQAQHAVAQPLRSASCGIWPSDDGARVYVGLENDDSLVAIDTLTKTVIATIPIGLGPQAVDYVPNAVPEGDGQRLPLGVTGQAGHLSLAAGEPQSGAEGATSFALFDQAPPDAAGLGDRTRASASVRARALAPAGRRRCTGADGGIRHQPGGRLARSGRSSGARAMWSTAIW